MRFVGQAEVSAYLASCPEHGDAVRAWLAEIKGRSWTNYAALASDFLSVDTSSPPKVVFDFPPSGLRIGTLVDLRTGVVLLTSIQLRPITSPENIRNHLRGH